MAWLRKNKRKTVITVTTEQRQQLYRSSAWQKLRAAKLAQSPLCELCEKATPATEVHHIYSPFKYGYVFAFDFDNLLSLCSSCHGQLHAKKEENKYYHIYDERKKE